MHLFNLSWVFLFWLFSLPSSAHSGARLVGPVSLVSCLGLWPQISCLSSLPVPDSQDRTLGGAEPKTGC